VKLRTGRRNGRNLYLQRGDEPDHDRDLPIGMVDSSDWADLIVTAVNDSGMEIQDWVLDWHPGDFSPWGEP
jgi:hypothetical protein